MPRVPVTLPLGGYDGSAASAEQLPGTYASGLNVRSINPRSKRQQLARRPGLTAVAESAVDDGSVTAMFRVGRDTQPDRYRTLTTTPQAGVKPDQLEVSWETALDDWPLAGTRSAGGERVYAVLRSGAVAILTAEGSVTETIPSQRPVLFETVDAIAVDDLGGVIIGYSFSRRVDGAAGYLVRMVKNDRGAWERAWLFATTGSIAHFVYDAGVLLVGLHRPANIESGPLATLARIGGVTTSQPTASWEIEVAYPVSRVAVNAKGDVFVASPPNAGRAEGGAVSVGSASVSWTPREPVATHLPNPEEQLYWWTSAEHLQNSEAVGNGSTVGYWPDARQEESDWDPVLDASPPASVQGRSLYRLVVTTGTEQLYINGRLIPVSSGTLNLISNDANSLAPTWQPSAVGIKGGIRYEPEHDEPRRLVTNLSTSVAPKPTAQSVAPTHTRILPRMTDGSTSARFVTTFLVRVQNWQDGATTYATPKVIFSQEGLFLTEYRLSYKQTPSASTLDVTLDLPGSPAGFTGTYTVTGSTHTEETTLVISIVHGGIGVAASEWYVNGNKVGGTFTMDSVGNAIVSSVGGPQIGYAGQGMRGLVLEVVTVLGATTTTPHDTTPTANLRERLEGYAAHRYGLQGALAGGHTYAASPPPGTGDTQLDLRDYGLSSPRGILAKYTAGGQQRWWVDGSRYGNGVVAGPGDILYTAGTPSTGGASPVVRVGKLRDEGGSVVSSGTGLWGVSFAGNLQWSRPGVDLMADGFGNLYVPWAIAGAGATREVRRYERDGQPGNLPLLGWSIELNTTANTDEVPVSVVGVGDSIDVPGANGYEGLVALTQNETIRARRISTIGTLLMPREGTREVALLAVTEAGNVRHLVGGAWSTIGSNVFTGIRPWMATVYPFSIIGDGVNPYLLLDHRSMRLRQLEGNTTGEVPPRSPVGFAWRRRIGVLNANARHQLAYSAYGNVLDWDPARTLVTSTAPVTTTFSAAAEYPDLIRNVVPWNDDLAIVFCDSSVWRQTGDPMTGGQQDQLAPDVGLADDWAWARDPQGSVYFLATDRRVWRMDPTGAREPLTRGAVWSRMIDIDLVRHRVEMRWSIREDALWVLVLPRLRNFDDVEHFVWERATGAWHPQSFGGGPGRAVTAVANFDGDGVDDVATLLGFADGRIRRIDEYALDDDGVAVGSHVTLGPLLNGSQEAEVRLVSLDVALGSDGGSLDIGARGASIADVPGRPRRVRTARAGRLSRLPLNLRAPYVWLDLTGRDGQPWSVESMRLDLAGGLDRRQRR